MFQLDYQENGRSTGTLRLNSSRWLNRLTARPTVVSIMPAFAKDRHKVEDFIIDVYAQSYGARIGVHYPILMSISDDRERILAALGFRYATQDTLFLEQYLRSPVETVLNTSRDKVTEIGNLASAGGGASMFLFAALSAYLHDREQRYAVVTSTDFLQKRFHDLGLKPEFLADANPALLLHRDENWGTYYNTRPRVLAGQVDQGYRRLQAALGAHYTTIGPRVIPRLHYREDTP